MFTRRRLLILVAVAAFLIGVVGLGRPRRFLLRIADVLALEGPDGVAAFIQVRRPSRVALVDDPFLGPTAYLFKAEVAADGSVRVARYRPRRYLTLRPGLTKIVRLGGAFFLDESSRDSGPTLHRFGAGDDLDAATDAERAAYRESGPSPEWTPLEGNWLDFESSRHGIAIREEETEVGHRMVAESTDPARPWRRVLVDVDSRPWYAYAGPFDDLSPP
ncbi:hypothetical protein [Paludisphaera soli]|uniref:hypothetical protein n=1 Tax=Paludisphaera soli TaxID=2712865 RepID=UPI0013EC39C2|nr:hypothetical protein [Paludisphaera soli]